MMIYTQKVVGTSFRNLDLEDFNLDFTMKLPENTLEAVIVPEPSNGFDKNAKRIEVINPFNPEVRHHIGYLGKDSILYNLTKSYTKNNIPCQVKVVAWSTTTKKGKPMSDSYTVLIDKAHSENEASLYARIIRQLDPSTEHTYYWEK